MINSFNVPDPVIEKFGPWSSKLDFINKYVTLNDLIYDALRQIWHVNHSLPSAPSITDRVKEIGIAKGYEDYEADSFAKAFTRSTAKARYKPVAKKVIPVSTYDPDSIVPEYKPLEIKDPGPLPLHPRKLEDIEFTQKLTKERVDRIIGNIPAGFLSKAELELVLHVIFKHEEAFAFTHQEQGTFSSKYYPDYIIRTVPHEPWQIPPIHLPAAKRATIMEMLEDQRSAGKYELCASSYRSAFFTVEKKGGLL